MRMSTLTMSALTLGTFGLLGASACHHRGGNGHAGDHHESSGREPELGSGVSTGLAVRSIANARCNREQRCDNIGAGKKWESEGECEAKTKADWSDDLNKYECPQASCKPSSTSACATSRPKTAAAPSTRSRAWSAARWRHLRRLNLRPIA